MEIPQNKHGDTVLLPPVYQQVSVINSSSNVKDKIQRHPEVYLEAGKLINDVDTIVLFYYNLWLQNNDSQAHLCLHLPPNAIQMKTFVSAAQAPTAASADEPTN